MKLRLLLPWTLAKCIASSAALLGNGIQLSEVCDADGAPLPDKYQEFAERAHLVAFEGVQIRRHLGLVP